MTARPRSAILMLSAVLLLVGRPGTSAAAQSASGPLGRGTELPCGQVHLFMLNWIKAPDKATATRAGKDLREMLRSKFDRKEWCVIPKEQTDLQLSGSGFKTDTVLGNMDAMQLANPVRADVFLQAEISGFQYSGLIYYVGDDHAWLRERVPKQDEASNGTQAATFFTARIKEVLKAYDPTKKCLNFIRDEKFAEGAAAAQQAIAAFPETVVGRYCLAGALQGQKRPPDEVLKVVNDVLARDSFSPRALLIAITQYEAKHDTASYERAAGQFVAIDPGNTKVENIVQTLSDWHHTQSALAIISQALAADQDNKNLLRAEFRLIYGGGNWKEAIKKGEALAKLDTAAVDSFFVRRMFSAYSNDSQPEKVLVWLKRGTEMFPDNVSFTIGYALQLTKLNQIPAALEAYKRLLRTHPETPEIRLRIANAYDDLGQTDSAFVWLHEADKHGTAAEKPIIAGVALTIGGKYFTAAQQSKQVADYKKGIPFFTFSDSVNVGEPPLAKFLIGASAFSIAQTLALSLDPNGTCETAKEAKTWADMVSPMILDGKGGRAKPDAAGPIMNQLQSQLLPYLDQWMKSKKCN